MMSEFWQQAVTVVLLAGAAGYLVHRLITWRRRRKSCAECKLMKQVRGLGEKPSEESHAN